MTSTGGNDEDQAKNQNEQMMVGMMAEDDSDEDDLMAVEIPQPAAATAAAPKQLPINSVWDDNAIETVLQISLDTHDKETIERWEAPSNDAWTPSPVPLPSWARGAKSS
mmetsp:Transcript_15632/g.35853  ORF Transcript_15632/g.35853 Transcript_15632/m.35853 type:complete len:109 (-) Transcript_15632:371-697(-)